jgi:hypothetical protein
VGDPAPWEKLRDERAALLSQVTLRTAALLYYGETPETLGRLSGAEAALAQWEEGNAAQWNREKPWFAPRLTTQKKGTE